MHITPIESLPDADLLRQYIDSRSPQAFAALVERYLPLIYSAALRQTHDPHLAEDIVQATLIVFSQRAARIDPPILVGWLLKTTHFVARNALRQQFRRARYEQRAAAMKSETQTESTDADAISKVIDPALAKLRDADRTAVVLRYFQNKSFADIAASMNTTEVAVQKRVSRAVRKLRDILAGQGVTVAPAALPVLLGSLKLHPVPPSLSLHAATLSSSKSAITSSLAKGALKTMATATKLKISVATIVAILLVGASVPTVYYYAHQPEQSQQTQPSNTATMASVAWLPKGTDLSKPITGSLPPGLKANVIAIMRIDDGQWLSPTGGLATGLPLDVDNHLGDLNTSASYALLYTISRSRDLSIMSRVVGAKSRGSTGWSNVLSPQYMINAFDPENGSDSVQLAISVGDGPWTDVVVMPASATAEVDGVSNGFTAKLYPATQDKQGDQGVHIRCKMPDIPDTAMQLISIDGNGKTVDCQGMSDNGQSAAFAFPGTLARLKEFHLQVRPYNYHATYAAVPIPH